MDELPQIPDDPKDREELFRKLCENYADEEDEGGPNRAFNHKARDALLAFCHAYAYKVNEIW